MASYRRVYTKSFSNHFSINIRGVFEVQTLPLIREQNLVLLPNISCNSLIAQENNHSRPLQDWTESKWKWRADVCRKKHTFCLPQVYNFADWMFISDIKCAVLMDVWINMSMLSLILEFGNGWVFKYRHFHAQVPVRFLIWQSSN